MRHGAHPRGIGALVALILAAIVGVSACAGTDQPAPAAATAAVGGLTATPEPGVSSATGLGATSAAASTAPSAPSPDASSASSAPAAGTTQATDPSPRPDDAAPSAATGPLTLPDAAPVSLSVPAIGVTSPLSSLGRNPDGTVEVPSLDDPNAGAGWFRDSPEPGSLGPAIILGHVDSRQYGPGVFYDLKNLKPGDTIEIARADATVAVFTVDSVQDVPKAQFPTQQVYGNLDHAGLRLITCGGVFDSEARSYEDNIIAFASLTSSRPA